MKSALLMGLVWSLVLLFVETLCLLVGDGFSWEGVGVRWAFVAIVLFTSCLGQPYPAYESHYILSWLGLTIFLFGVPAATLAAYSENEFAAWIALVIWYGLLPGLARLLLESRGRIGRYAGAVLLALLWGAVPVAVAEVQSHFADEEFFAALQALCLAAFSLLLIAAWRIQVPWPIVLRSGVRVRPPAVGLVVLGLAVAGILITVSAYQRSFYPDAAPSFPGISAATPFLCGIAPTVDAGGSPEGREVFQRLLARVAANPLKGAPEFGMLALGSGEHPWAEDFRRSLLGEASLRLFTGPMNSLKAEQIGRASCRERV